MRKATAAARELGRLGEWKPLRAIGTPEAEKLLDDNPLWVPVSS